MKQKRREPTFVGVAGTAMPRALILVGRMSLLAIPEEAQHGWEAQSVTPVDSCGWVLSWVASLVKVKLHSHLYAEGGSREGSGRTLLS